MTNVSSTNKPPPKRKKSRRRRRTSKGWSRRQNKGQIKEQSEMTLHFLRLPAELRNMIYGYALQGRGDRWNAKSPWEEYRGPESSSASLIPSVGMNINLMRACKQIYQETKALLFELNTFSLWVKFVPNMQEAIALWPVWPNIRHINIIGSAYGAKELCSLVDILLAHTNLTVNQLTLHVAMRAGDSEISTLRNLRVRQYVMIKLHTALLHSEEVNMFENELRIALPNMMPTDGAETKIVPSSSEFSSHYVRAEARSKEQLKKDRLALKEEPDPKIDSGVDK